MKWVAVFLVTFAIGLPRAMAFPEMARIGYQNCIACHVSPAGGGVMTPYGRGMASDILSTWHYDGEETLGHGLFKNQDGSAYQTPEWIQVGGESRWIQTYVNNLQATQTQWFPMQNEIEGAVHALNTWFVGNLNFLGGPPGSPNYGNLVSDRLYALYNVTEDIYVRAGKFMIPFGIFQPNHTAVIAQGLGWDVGTETDNIEAGYVGEKFNFIATGDFGRPDNSNLSSEKGYALNFAYNLMTTHKLGWSFFNGDTLTTTRQVTGPYAILGFWRNLVLLSQFDMQWKFMKDPTTGPDQHGFVSFNRLQYELFKGFHPYLIQQLSYLNSSSVGSRTDSYGGGIMWYPRPHFELWAEWDKVRNESVADLYTDSAWLVLHYYL